MFQRHQNDRGCRSTEFSVRTFPIPYSLTFAGSLFVRVGVSLPLAQPTEGNR
jgi:hypothetical protein